MAFDIQGTRVTITATATSLTSLLATAGLTVPPAPGLGYSTIILRAGTANAGVTYIGRKTSVTAAGAPQFTVTGAGANAIGFLAANEALAIDSQGGGLGFTDNIGLIGTASDTVYVLIQE